MNDACEGERTETSAAAVGAARRPGSRNMADPMRGVPEKFRGALKAHQEQQQKRTPQPTVPQPTLPQPNPVPNLLAGRAYPINFRQRIVQPNLDFGFKVECNWDSSDGNLQSLADVRVAEIIVHPQARRPMKQASNPNGIEWLGGGTAQPGQKYMIPADGRSGIPTAGSQASDLHQYRRSNVTIPCPDVRDPVTYVVQQQYVFWYVDRPNEVKAMPQGKFEIEYKFVQHRSSASNRWVWCIYTTKRGLDNPTVLQQREYGGDYA